MSRAQEIRDTLANGQLPFKQLHLKLGGDDKKLLDLCCYLRGRGEVKIADDEGKTIKLTGRRAAPPQGKGKKPAGKKDGRPYKKLADAHAGKHTNGEGLRNLAIDSYIGAGALLRQAIEDNVEIDPDNFALRHAIDNHERVEKLLGAARAA